MMTRAWVGLAAFSLLSLGLTAAPQQAAALDCSASPTDAKTEWVYRTFEGRKCWYRGTKVIPKSELRWADADQPQISNSEMREAQASMTPAALREAAAIALPAPTNDERHPVVRDVNVDQIEINQADTFDARWRGLPR
jgi:hypothetical protein